MSASLTLTTFTGQAKALDTLTLDTTGNALGSNPSLPKVNGQPRATLYRHDVYDRDQQLSIVSKGGGTVMVKQPSTGKCLNAYRPTRRSAVNFWPCSDSDGDQRFHLELNGNNEGRLRRAGTNLCVDAPSRTTTGSRIHLYDCMAGNANQKWKRNPIINNPAAGLPSTVTIVSRPNNLALDAGGDSNNSIYGHRSPNKGNRWHQWDLRRVGNYYLITNKQTGRALDAGGKLGADVYPHPQPNAQNDYHLWRIESVGGGNFILISKATGRALDSGGRNYDIYAHPKPIRDNQYHHWKLADVGSGGSNGGGSSSGDSSWQSPVGSDWYVASGYGYRGGKMHSGIDLNWGSTAWADYGKPIQSVRAGRVSRIGWESNGFGNFVVVDHGDGFLSYYAHLSSVTVKQGDRVSNNSVVGKLGNSGNSTGPHLHFSMKKNGRWVNPNDYIKF